jgi:uncharacterized membrane protein
MAKIKLRDVPLFRKMDEKEIAGIREIMDEIRFKAGQVIIHEGEIGNLFYVITGGHVEVTTRDADGSDVVLHKGGPGDFFGELSMLTNEPRSAHVRAVDNVTTLALERDEFFGFLRTHTHAAIDVLVELGGRLRDNDRIFQTMVSRNVNRVVEENMTTGQRLADRAADLIGSWRFIVVQSLLIVVWITLNVTALIQHWDPYPFVLMNVVLSFQAAFAGPVIMMSQNRQSGKDRLAAEIDHQVNAKAELEISNLLRRVSDLELTIEENQAELKSLLGGSKTAKKTSLKSKV